MSGGHDGELFTINGEVLLMTSLVENPINIIHGWISSYRVKSSCINNQEVNKGRGFAKRNGDLLQ